MHAYIQKKVPMWQFDINNVAYLVESYGWTNIHILIHTHTHKNTAQNNEKTVTNVHAYIHTKESTYVAVRHQ